MKTKPKPRRWASKATLPRRKGWYITRRDDGDIDWRAWGNGAWWKQHGDGWVEWFDVGGNAMTYDFRPDSRRDIKLDRDQLPEPEDVR